MIPHEQVGKGGSRVEQEFRVRLSIRTIQRQPDGAVNRTQQQARGLLWPQGEGWRLRYWETSEGLAGCQVDLTLGPEGVRVSRSGPAALELDLRPGLESVTPYRICGMEYRLLARAGQLMWQLDERGGSVRLCYQLELEGGLASRHRMEFTLRRVEA